MPNIAPSFSPANDFDLKPKGLGSFQFNSDNYVCSITLSNKSGKTYSYSGSLTPSDEDRIVSSDASIRAEIESVDSVNGTLELDEEIEEGTYTLSKHLHIDYNLPEPDFGCCWYLWGVFFNVKNNGENDFVKLEVITALGEDVKEYDECWVEHLNAIVQLTSPDKAPAELPYGLGLRIDYYPTEAGKTIKVKYDYILTIKS